MTLRRISVQFDHDPQKLVAHYMTLQEEYRRLLGVKSKPASSVEEDIGLMGTIREESAVYAAKEVDLLALLQGDS